MKIVVACFAYMVLVGSCYRSFSQGNRVAFVSAPGWKGIVQLARAENKYIFVDCYASWCGPCKRMDADVYGNEEAARFFNSRFVCVKLQMDSTAHDGDSVIRNYGVANEIKVEYEINAYPTFLFFSPEGKIVHRSFGYHDVNTFIKLGEDAMNPHEQFYTLLQRYRDNSLLDSGEMMKLAEMATLLHEEGLAHRIANDYINGLTPARLLTPDNIYFAYRYTTSSRDRGFSFFKDSAEEIQRADSIMVLRASRGLLMKIIDAEEIEPYAKRVRGQPDWKRIDHNIGKYGALGKEALDEAKPELVFQAYLKPQLEKNPEWNGIIKLVKAQHLGGTEKYLVGRVLIFYEGQLKGNPGRICPDFVKGCQYYRANFPDLASPAVLNDFAWQIFTHDNRPADLNLALSWAKCAVDSADKANIQWQADFTDTYSNLLYKLGRRKEAIEWEERAIVLSPKEALTEGLKKMEAGTPTWETHLPAQRPVIDQNAVAAWPVINAEGISNDGKYVWYQLGIGAPGIKGKRWCVVVKATDGSLNKVVDNTMEAAFSGDSRSAIARTLSDSLRIIRLDGRADTAFAGVKSFKWSGSGTRESLAIQFLNDRLELFDLNGGVGESFEHVATYGFSSAGEALFVVQDVSDDGEKQEKLTVYNMGSKKTQELWHGLQLTGMVFGEGGSQLAFLTKTAGQFSIGVWREEMDTAMLWVRNSRDAAGDSVIIQNGGIQFLPGMNGVTFQVKPYRPADSVKVTPLVGIWSYKDQFEESPDLPIGAEDRTDRSYLAVANFGSPAIVTLGSKEDAYTFLYVDQNKEFPFALTATLANGNEGYRLKIQRPDVMLISLKDGTRKCIAKEIEFAYPVFSPSGKYVIWDDPISGNYFTYNIASGKVANITKDVPEKMCQEWDIKAPSAPWGIGNWLAGDKGVLVYDRYDIWLLDPDGVVKPVDLTNGYGRRHRIVLRNVYFDGRRWPQGPPLNTTDTLLLCAFDERSKENGFFRTGLHPTNDPTKLILSANVYYFSEVIRETDFNERISKARGSEVYLLKKMSAKEFPNLYTTKDFKHFSTVSDVQPEKEYNWLTAEPVRWKTFTGRTSEGILYRPENFDSTKKYPIIFYFYERLSDGINLFQDAAFSNGPINIPWFVSRGYLVFCPDIEQYSIGDPGASIYDYVVSAATFMSKKKWVDAHRMGMEGHSWGGYEVNYLVTRTKIFAAAVSAAGISDVISLYGLQGFSRNSGPAPIEQRQNRMGGSLWDRPGSFIRNSPIFRADRVTTPLLMMHNPGDRSVPWEQSVEYFTLLRRLGKPSWTLEYKIGGHQVSGAEAEDLTKRVTDFFDYYLKGGERPGWLKE